jgi:hypothetical protein
MLEKITKSFKIKKSNKLKKNTTDMIFSLLSLKDSSTISFYVNICNGWAFGRIK